MHTPGPRPFTAAESRLYHDFAETGRQDEHIQRLGAVTGRSTIDLITLERHAQLAAGDSALLGWLPGQY